MLDGSCGCVMFEPHWLRPDKCVTCMKSILKHSREAVQKEIYIQRAIEYIIKGPSKILQIGNVSLFHGGMDCITKVSIIEENDIGFVVNTARGLGKVFGKKFINAVTQHKTNGVVFVNLGLLDMPTQKLADEILEVGLKCIHEGLHVHKRSVLVNCAQGKSRSASIVVAYIMCIKDTDYENALQIVKEKRKMAQPNIGFEKQLKQWRSSDAFLKTQKILKDIS